MNKKQKLISWLVISSIIIITYIIFKNGIQLDFNINNLRSFIHEKEGAPIIFIGLWIVRLIVAIPGVTLMVLGGLIFLPFNAVIFSLIGLIISDSLVYLIGKSNLFINFRNKINKNHGEIINLIQRYNYKFLALGILCPIAPTDVICYLSARLGISYFKYLVTLIVANIPALILYSYLGESFQESIYNTLFIIITLTITAVLSLRMWRKLKT